MESENKIMNIYQKLQKCRVELQRKKLKKSGKNSFAGFDYFELADFLPAVNDLFDKYGLHSRFNIKDGIATLNILNAENPEEFEVFETPIAEANLKGCTPIQSLGGIHTYLRRYLYVNALEITDGDLINGMTNEDIVQTMKTPLEEATIRECGLLNIDLRNVAAYLRKPVEELTEEEVQACIARKKGSKSK